MSSTDCIDQIGIIEEVKEHSVRVRFQSAPACGSCSAKSLCSPATPDNKIIEIENQNEGFTVGESVKISISKKMGFIALFFGYVLPFLLVLCTLIFTISLGIRESLSGLLSISILLPYYFLIYLFREKMNHMFIFTLDKLY